MVDWLRLWAAIRLTPTQQISVPFVGGAILNWPAASSSVMICARYGLGEYADMAFCLHFLRSDDLFCDVGANAGVYTILASRAVGARAVAFEPVPGTFDLLMQNVHANHVGDRVDARRVGVGRQPGRLHFTASLWSYNHVVVAGSGATVEVDVSTLDTLLEGRVPAVIKIDVEGYELEVVAGARVTLSSPELRAVLLEMYEGHVARYGGTLEEIRVELAAAGLQGPFWYDPDTRALVEAGHYEKRKFNQIFVRDRAEVDRRVKSAARYDVHGVEV